MYEMTTDEVLQAIEAKEDILLIDVREADEVAAGHIENSLHIPLGEVPQAVESLQEQNKKMIMICRSGARSANATMYLRQFDIEAYNMIGGILDWRGELIY
ncbi:sulfurtransferase [Lysinibacillus alkalisoli]|uniref:Sulfurtransferase n=1 Tax=Lysinibacillus alkalisoli TaxID=1911548 RepID=A0A917G6W0_9BACI|nr:rhodanese-like domain-containing protein [Lysinibacillus alkalisoli]GGG25213.1 sulfurtransferase [Lysinibacillus alkalisoli]